MATIQLTQRTHRLVEPTHRSRQGMMIVVLDLVGEERGRKLRSNGLVGVVDSRSGEVAISSALLDDNWEVTLAMEGLC